jgi:RHS repeat-associated protein
MDKKHAFPLRMGRIAFVLIAQVYLCSILSPPCCLAEDKSGVSPNTISLPSGPGSIEGLGDAFQPMLNTGTAGYVVHLALPGGVAGHTPKLSLTYESGQSYGPAGIGWRLGPGSVSRQVEKGIPGYLDEPGLPEDDPDGGADRFIDIEGEELVELEGGVFRARVEGAFIRYRRLETHWEAHLGNGTRLEFGLTPQGRVTDQAGTRVFSWLLERSTDTNGNVIEYTYASFPESENQKYLQEIRYGPGAPPWNVFYFARLSWEDRPDWVKDYRSGFMIRTAKRLSRVDIGIQGHLPQKCTPGDWNKDGATDALIRAYVFEYQEDYLCRSFLSEVTLFGSDGVNYLPPLCFSFSLSTPDASTSASGALMTAPTAPVAVMDNPLVELVDLNRDGLPDILKTDLYGGLHTVFLNLGEKAGDSGTEIVWDTGREITSEDERAPELHLANDRVHLADMDGDGLADLIHTALANEVFYHQNRGDLSWSNRERMSIRDTPPPAPFANEEVRTTDLDFNKRMDVVQSTESGYRVWFNLGGGRYSDEIRTAGAVYQGKTIRFSEGAAHLADMNGDRLNDVVLIRPMAVVYCASMGHGRFDEAVEIPIPDVVLKDGAGGQLARARLVDINGNGLADLVVERAEPGELWYWLNLGTDTFSGRHVVTGMPSLFGTHTASRWADINGNGTTDLIYADSTAATRLVALDIGRLVGGSDHPNLLTRIDNGLGVATHVSYRSSTEHYLDAAKAGKPWTTTVPFPVAVVSEVRVHTGLDGVGVAGVDEYVKTYRYKDGFYEDRQKAFRGFSEVIVTEWGDETSPTLVTAHEFFTGGPDRVDNDGDGLIDEMLNPWGHREEDALKGLLKSKAVRSADDVLFRKDENVWRVRNLAVTGEGMEVRFAYKEKTETKLYEGTETPETLMATFAYDDYGNMRQEKNYGALSIAGDEAFTFTEYINDKDLWIIGLPRSRCVTDGEGGKFSEILNYYDGEDFVGLSSGQVTRGNLTRQQGWVAGETYVNRVRNAYDPYGNIAATMDPNGRRRTIDYDAIMGAYPVEEAIEIGMGKADLTVQAAWNLGLGVIAGSVDFNGRRTEYSHDVFGRITAIARPGDTAALPTLSFSYTMADPAEGLLYAYDGDGVLSLTSGVSIPSSVKTRAREVSGQPGTFDTIEYVDGLGRKLATVEEGEEGFVVKEAVLFNAAGTPRYAFLPYEAGSAEYAPPDISMSAVEMTYDAPGREILRVNPPDAAGVITSAGTGYLPLSRTVTDENGNPRTFLSDGLENLIEVREQNQGETYVTRYSYDPAGNLREITDAQNNVKGFEYDGLSRRTALNDPDRGRMAYIYDPAGNVIRTVDNKGREIVYTYDGAGRMLTEDYLDGGGITPDVEYRYDSPAEEHPHARNTKGRLSRVRDLSGALFFSYDEGGNREWGVKRIRDGGFVHDFGFRFAHDAMGRVVTETFPDGDRVRYTYNNRALLESIPGFVNAVEYHPSGRIKSYVYANGWKTSYDYDPRNRLKRLTTSAITPGSGAIQDLAYEFDGVSNITAVTDHRALPAGSPGNATQAFQYDDLYRLTRAAGPGYGAVLYQYDRIGNMTYKSSPPAPDPEHIEDPIVNLGTMTSGGAAGTSGRGRRMPGEAPGPHAVTGTASGLVFAYDDNGNMIGRGGDVYEWDFKDRLVKTATAETAVEYVYDYSGQRVIKRARAGDEEKTVYYVGSNYEIRDGRTVKYVFDGARRVARVEGRLSASGEDATQSIPLQPGWNVVSFDVAPENPRIGSVLGAAAGTVTDVWAFDATLGQYVGYTPGEGRHDLAEMHAQKGYLLYATAPVMLTVTGTKASGHIPLAAGWNLIGGPADGLVSIEEGFSAVAGDCEEVWAFDASSKKWMNHAPDMPSFLSNLAVVEPGRAYWVKMKQAGAVPFVASAIRKHFYHPDHLGSANVVTDESGAVVETTEFYPYGRPRHEERTGFDSAYKYTGKELDRESGLIYCEARYYDPVIGRFASVDPLGIRPEEQFLDLPNSLHAYGYALGNPMGCTDPTGLQPKKEIWEDPSLAKFKGISGYRPKDAALGTKQQLFLTPALPPVGTREFLFELGSMEDKGAAWLMTETQYEKFVKSKLGKGEMVGRPDGQFAISVPGMEELMKQTGGDTKKLAEALGTTWGPEERLYRIQAGDPKEIRPPSESTPGANVLFRPGGRTIGGLIEFEIKSPTGKEIDVRRLP